MYIHTFTYLYIFIYTHKVHTLISKNAWNTEVRSRRPVAARYVTWVGSDATFWLSFIRAAEGPEMALGGFPGQKYRSYMIIYIYNIYIYFYRSCIYFYIYTYRFEAGGPLPTTPLRHPPLLVVDHLLGFLSRLSVVHELWCENYLFPCSEHGNWFPCAVLLWIVSTCHPRFAVKGCCFRMI